MKSGHLINLASLTTTQKTNRSNVEVNIQKEKKKQDRDKKTRRKQDQRQEQTKTRHDKARQHKTAQHSTAQHANTQHKHTTRHDTTRHDTTRHDTPRHILVVWQCAQVPWVDVLSQSHQTLFQRGVESLSCYGLGVELIHDFPSGRI
jgi:hypothetical protein